LQLRLQNLEMASSDCGAAAGYRCTKGRDYCSKLDEAAVPMGNVALCA